ncbi:hypothetical protein QBC32DRAFT_381440, partial [Pseudoneurospora amorphoporcata]
KISPLSSSLFPLFVFALSCFLTTPLFCSQFSDVSQTPYTHTHTHTTVAMDARQTAKLTLPGFFEIWLRCLTIILADLGWIGMVVAYVALGSVAQAILTLLGPALVDLFDFLVSTLAVLVAENEVDSKGA